MNETDLEDHELTQIQLTLPQIVIHIICLVFGIPVNFFVAGVLVLNRRLHRVRNALWLGIISCNLLTLLMALLELLSVLGSSQLACIIFSALTLKPNVIHMLFLVLMAIERSFYLSHPTAHKKYVTVRRVVCTQFTVIGLAFFVLNWPFWTGLVPIRCGFDIAAFKWITPIGFFLVVICITLQIKVYFQARHYLAMESEANANSFSNNILHSDRNCSCPTSVPTRSVTVRTTGMSRSELEATVIMVTSVILLAVFILPMYLEILVWWIWCNSMSPFECEAIQYASRIVRELPLLHAVFNLSIYVTQTREFISTLNKIQRNVSSSQC